MVAHGHITVNGHRVDVPSYLVRAGDRHPDKKPGKKSLQLAHGSLAMNSGVTMPDFRVSNLKTAYPRPGLTVCQLL